MHIVTTALWSETNHDTFMHIIYHDVRCTNNAIVKSFSINFEYSYSVFSWLCGTRGTRTDTQIIFFCNEFEYDGYYLNGIVKLLA